MICHLTGMEFEPKVTSQIVWPSILIVLLLKGFNLVFEGNIFSVSFHFFACCRLQTLTLAPVSAVTVVRVLFTMNPLWTYYYCEFLNFVMLNLLWIFWKDLHCIFCLQHLSCHHLAFVYFHLPFWFLLCF